RARNELGGDANAKLLIANSVELANAVFADSGIAVRLELAGAVHHDLPGGDSVTAVFEYLRTQPAVNALRRQHQADVVGAFVSEGTAYCGVGSLYSGGVDDAFHVVSWSCAQGNLSYPHEVGHNLSAHHNPENAEGGKPTSRAHYVCGEFRTVMGYPDPCSGYTPRVALFSNPTKTWAGQPAGIPGQRDNATSMNQASPTVALFAESAFSDRSACVPGDSTLCLAGGRFEVRMDWQDGETLRQARAVAMSDESGYFWFFRDGNVEVLTKVIDGCAANSHYWSFLTGLTDRGFEVTVRDTKSGLSRSYSNTKGQAFVPVQDTGAFPTCA
ncbi:MAG TPA: M12 family metallo-peptidase, partial [Thermoanaerobaculia bacterium]|nr:M12 family metallo-peptidase [Thermoanaerobaculia bacterium]